MEGRWVCLVRGDLMGSSDGAVEYLDCGGVYARLHK